MNTVQLNTDAAQAPRPTWLERAGSARLTSWTSYLFSIAITLATLAVRFGLNEFLDEEPALVIFTIPIMLSAYFGGLGPGLLATALSFFGAS